MNRIRLLPQTLANQIAAGEVIERPASVIKELLENALDAKASSISVDIGHGGLNHIIVSDNGCGILADDLVLAITPHATSKIFHLDDLYAIQSMGFRGEALASIASISDLTIISKTQTDVIGARLQRIGEEQTIQPCPRTQGTTIEVRDLFYNVPVRKKFLKSARVEFQAIETVMKRFALSAPEIGLRLTHDGIKKWALMPAVNDTLLRLRRITLLGSRFIERAIPVHIEHGDLYIQGLISGLSDERSQSDKLWFFLNGRMIKDALLTHAIKQAYAGLLYPSRFPACLLYITMPPEAVDVNVHPTKHEVRFQDPRLIHDLLTTHVRDLLQPSSDLGDVEPIGNAGTVDDFMISPVPENDAMSLPSSAIHMSSSTPSYVALTPQFMVFVLPTGSYLVDFLALYHMWLHYTLQTADKPLVHRTLGIPLYGEYHGAHNKEMLHFLSNLGMNIAVNDDTGEWRIKTLPLIGAYLDIQSFLQALSVTPPDWEAVCDQFVRYQICHTHQLTDEDCMNCYTYFLNNTALHDSPIARLLSSDDCTDFLLRH